MSMPTPLPPPEIIRPDEPPDDLLLVVRGGRSSLSDLNLERATGDCWQRYGFFGVSVFAAPGDDLVSLSHSVGQIRRRPEVRVSRCGTLRESGFDVVATFVNPSHYSVVLPDAGPQAFEQLRSCFSEPRVNPGYEADR
jgi:hypothetical protein